MAEYTPVPHVMSTNSELHGRKEREGILIFLSERKNKQRGGKASRLDNHESTIFELFFFYESGLPPRPEGAEKVPSGLVLYFTTALKKPTEIENTSDKGKMFPLS